MPVLRSTSMSIPFFLPNREGVFQMIWNCNAKHEKGVTLVRVAPMQGNRIMVKDAFWIDWDTDVVIAPRPQVLTDD